MVLGLAYLVSSREWSRAKRRRTEHSLAGAASVSQERANDATSTLRSLRLVADDDRFIFALPTHIH